VLGTLQGSYRSGKTGKSQGIWEVRERSGENSFFGKVEIVRENEKLVPPDGSNASSLISAGAPPHTPLGELTVLPQIH